MTWKSISAFCRTHACILQLTRWALNRVQGDMLTELHCGYVHGLTNRQRKLFYVFPEELLRSPIALHIVFTDQIVNI